MSPSEENSATPNNLAPDDGNPESCLPSLFTDPLLGTALNFYVHEDAVERAAVMDTIRKNGGVIHTAYSTVPYILVNPQSESGQSLWRLYNNKKGKVVLDSEWVFACLREKTVLSMGHSNEWGGYQVKGSASEANPAEESAAKPKKSRKRKRANSVDATSNLAKPKTPVPSNSNSTPTGPATPGIDSLQQQHPYGVHDPQVAGYSLSRWPSMGPVGPEPHPAASGMMAPGYPLTGPWDGPAGHVPGPSHYGPPSGTHDDANGPNPYAISGWPDVQNRTYSPMMYYPPPEPYSYMIHSQDHANMNSYHVAPEAPPSAGPPPDPVDEPAPQIPPDDPPKPRKKRILDQAADPAALVQPMRPPRREPTPPPRAVTSSHGGNAFTSDDIAYLHKYIEFCRDMGWMLSLREICEKLAIKAPHHSFFSWRRYCNKHKIRIEPYSMAVPESNANGSMDPDLETPSARGTPGSEVEGEQSNEGSQSQARSRIEIDPSLEASFRLPSSSSGLSRPVSQVPVSSESAHPAASSGEVNSAKALTSGTGGHNAQGATPILEGEPKAPQVLERSSTGKGIAFTKEDIDFLMNFMAFRRGREGESINMVQFWTDVAHRAPHHSRASWMKYWRRHRHELEGDTISTEVSTPKRSRYSHEDDILLARFLIQRQEGAQDSLFREFAADNPQHPWKGWQEHARLHKAEITHMIDRLRRGEDITNARASPAPQSPAVGIKGDGVGDGNVLDPQ